MHLGMKRLWAISRKKHLRVAGLMSGTSVDGVDVAIVDIANRRTKLVAFEMIGYSPTLRKQIFELFDPATASVDKICHMNFVLGEVFAQAVLGVASRAGVELSTIDAIGSHGQTIWHAPRPAAFGAPFAGRSRGGKTASTLQIGDASVIARRTGIVTVADFRPSDISAGGQGAPLVPFADLFLFGHPRRTRAVQNIGGIANVTYLPAAPCPRLHGHVMGTEAAGVLAFDTGPGNMMIDRSAAIATAGRWNYDRDGKLAAKAQVSRPLLAQLMRHPYLRRKPPKSTGRELFGAQATDDLWAQWRQKLTPGDFVATLTAFTAASIADAYRRLLPSPVDEAIICGGGARNPTLVAMLSRELAPTSVVVMDELGLSADAKEAVSFAILAAQTIRGLPANVPSATGASSPAVLGKIAFP